MLVFAGGGAVLGRPGGRPGRVTRPGRSMLSRDGVSVLGWPPSVLGRMMRPGGCSQPSGTPRPSQDVPRASGDTPSVIGRAVSSHRGMSVHGQFGPKQTPHASGDDVGRPRAPTARQPSGDRYGTSHDATSVQGHPIIVRDASTVLDGEDRPGHADRPGRSARRPGTGRPGTVSGVPATGVASRTYLTRPNTRPRGAF